MSRKRTQNIVLVTVLLLLFLSVGFLAVADARSSASFSGKIPLEEKELFYYPLQPENGNNFLVYVTPTGSRYHLYADCTSLARAKEIVGVSPEKAVTEGRTECAVCRERKEAEQKDR